MNVAELLRLYRFNFAYARELAIDIPSSSATDMPAAGLENHPVFVLGHLCTGSALLAKRLGCDGGLPEGWADLFQRRGPTDERLPEERVAWPTLEVALAELERQHAAVEDLIAAVPAERWSEPVEWRLSKYLPTLADLAWFMCITHESLHLGQLACWRRAMGLPSAMARL